LTGHKLLWFCLNATIFKVDCSGKRLMVCWKIWWFWNSYSYKIPWGSLYIWATVWGASWNFKSLFYTKMSFKFLKFSNRPSVFFPSIQLFSLSVSKCQMSNVKCFMSGQIKSCRSKNFLFHIFWPRSQWLWNSG
jgi:hypothetical protein